MLATFEPEERPVIEEAIALAADAVAMFGTEGIEPVMNRYNAPPAADEHSEENAAHERDSQP